jgi:Homing endonuclease associated repeat
MHSCRRFVVATTGLPLQKKLSTKTNLTGELTVPYDANLTADGLVSQLKEVAERLGKKSVSRSEFLRETGISEARVYKHFDSWNELVKATALEPIDSTRIKEDELFRAMRDAFLAAGKICTQRKFDKLCRYNLSVYKRRGWGNWIGVLARFGEWASANAPDFPFMADLPPAPPQNTPPELAGDTGENQRTVPRSTLAPWSAKGSRHYGSFLNFRGLLHAPINESGVVFLFGMVAQELGYVVESIRPGFPDCEAKRRVSKSGDTWERVRIEFEFASRTFLTHGHNVAHCDVIVCWEDNWHDCPIEVLELRTAIQSLEA